MATMSRKPFWKSYEVPEQCQPCPYVGGYKQFVQQRAEAVQDTLAALEVAGLQWELRRRKRQAQACVGSLAVAETDLVYCATEQRTLTASGETVNDGLDADTKQQLENFTDISELFPDDNPPEDSK